MIVKNRLILPAELPAEPGDASPVPAPKPKPATAPTTMAGLYWSTPDGIPGKWLAGLTQAAAVKVPIDMVAMLRNAGFPVRTQAPLEEWHLRWGLVTMDEARAALGLEAVEQGDRIPQPVVT